MSFTLLFDLDGTMVDTDPLHFRAFVDLLEENGKPAFDLDFYKTHVMGFGHAQIFSMLFPERDEGAHHALADRKEEMFRAQVRDVEPKEGLVDLLDWARERRLRCAVVTNAPRQNAVLLLGALRLGERFDAIVFGEELAHGKPHPMPYLTALDRIGGRAGTALAFEDSLSGVRAASAAGIFTVGVRSSLPAASLLGAGALHTVDDFRDPVLWSELRRRAG